MQHVCLGVQESPGSNAQVHKALSVMHRFHSERLLCPLCVLAAETTFSSATACRSPLLALEYRIRLTLRQHTHLLPGGPGPWLSPCQPLCWPLQGTGQTCLNRDVDNFAGLRTMPCKVAWRLEFSELTYRRRTTTLLPLPCWHPMPFPGVK